MATLQPVPAGAACALLIMTRVGESPASCACSLLNANKINCLRVNTFQDLQSLTLLSLYDNKLQTISKGLFAPLQSIQTL